MTAATAVQPMRIGLVHEITNTRQAMLEVRFLARWGNVERYGGDVRFAPLRLRVCEGKFREPDILPVRDANDPRRQNDYWRGADLVIEIVNPDNSVRDLDDKPRDYAEVGIPKYWIVNPLDETITVLTLAGDAYATCGVFRRGKEAHSHLLDGFAVRIDEVFDAQ
ncbi:Uma2 family endonuclease [Roseiflexus sp.]|uniref:Uma2 family endonuclease n=1 Tax=Roseiflexus sp. TaxID=2562120 RepID=UPI00398A7546